MRNELRAYAVGWETGSNSPPPNKLAEIYHEFQAQCSANNWFYNHSIGHLLVTYAGLFTDFHGYCLSILTSRMNTGGTAISMLKS